MSDRYVCIHGHFYQPPRENPWLEAIELQDSAYPYHDWNERITAECYGPNAAARILDDRGRIARIINNYARISFNVGPTLLAWLEDGAPEVYQAILDADVESRERYSGHGSALAQAYGHMIVPLANERDLDTQVRWGLADFEHRFGRPAEGMWLPETAVDVATLEVLAAHGVRFTILAPHQGRRVRKIGARSWRDVEGGRIDPTMPYEVRLPSGRKIAAFFYDGPVSQAVAFEGLLNRGEDFADRLTSLFADDSDRAQIVHIATDGETYGHHHPHGDLALGYAVEHIERNGNATLTNYGEYLERFPPTHIVEIAEATSWSCAHGVERWRSDCGCNTGRGWHQQWRAPLRNALDWLRDTCAPMYAEAAAELLTDPWEARNDYIDVVLDRSSERVDGWLDDHTNPAVGSLNGEQRTRALELLELQRHLMLAYTSCGWFFDELSGIETVQVMQYAERARQLASDLFGTDLGPELLAHLEQAPSNLPELGDGRQVYERMVRPAVVDPTKLAVHYGVASLFEDDGEAARIYCHDVERCEYRSMDAGRAQLAVGQVRLTSTITRASDMVTFGVLHLGDHNLTAGARAAFGYDAYVAIERAATEAFGRADFPEVIRRLDHHFGSSPYSLRTLLRDQQRRVLDVILDHTIAEAEDAFNRQYEYNAPLMRFLADIDVPLPRTFTATAELVMNGRLRDEFRSEELDVETVRALFEETSTWSLQLDVDGLSFALAGTVERMARHVLDTPHDGDRIQRLQAIIDLAYSLPWDVDLSRTQNVFYDVVQKVDGWNADGDDSDAAAVDEASGADEEEDAGMLRERVRAVAGRLAIAVDGA